MVRVSQLSEALTCIRQEIAPIITDTPKLHKLSRYEVRCFWSSNRVKSHSSACVRVAVMCCTRKRMRFEPWQDGTARTVDHGQNFSTHCFVCACVSASCGSDDSLLITRSLVPVFPISPRIGARISCAAVKPIAFINRSGDLASQHAIKRCRSVFAFRRQSVWSCFAAQQICERIISRQWRCSESPRVRPTPPPQDLCVCADSCVVMAERSIHWKVYV